jgi:hypothetical protein
MPTFRFPAAALCTAAVFAAAPVAASAADVTATGRAPASPDQTRPRVGTYKIVSHGAHVIHAKCLEGGNVVVPTHENATPAQRDRDIHAACKTVDYTR